MTSIRTFESDPKAYEKLRQAAQEHYADAGRAELAVVNRYAQAWVDGDMAAIVACYHDDFTLHYFGRNALSGDHVGKAAALATLAEFSKRTQRRLVRIRSTMAELGRACLVATETIGPQGVEVERVLVYTVRDGLLAECWVYDQDQRLIDGLIGG